MLHWKRFSQPGGGEALVDPQTVSHAFTVQGRHYLRLKVGPGRDVEITESPDQVAEVIKELSMAHSSPEYSFRINPEQAEYVTQEAQGVTMHLAGGTKVTIGGGTIDGFVYAARATAAHRSGRSIDDPPPSDVSVT